MTRRSVVMAALLGTSLAGPGTGADEMPEARVEEARLLMMDFAERTGLTGRRAPRRYLWTDAFAVCNFFGLARVTGDPQYRELALKLIGQVHRTLGRHRDDDPRTGWISGLDERQGAGNPVKGGLRIGKPLPERGPQAPFDERLEWERDGQYFHYLTKWMHALDGAARVTGNADYNQWARELAATAYDAFTYAPGASDGPGDRRRMYWKMSIDLSRPLVHSMGQHDPLDGYVSAVRLRATASLLDATAEPALRNETRGFAAMIERRQLTTVDPLGLGGLLVDAALLEQLRRTVEHVDDDLLQDLLAAAVIGLRQYARSDELDLPADRRLAFRELGLAIGLHGVEQMHARMDEPEESVSNPPAVRRQLEALRPFIPLAEKIESFWRRPAHRQSNIWREHRDINAVMLATSLVPQGFLVPGPSP